MLRIVPLYACELVRLCLRMFICLGLTVPDGSLSILIAQLFKLDKYCADRCNTQPKTGVTLNTHLETGVTINAPIEIEQPD